MTHLFLLLWCHTFMNFYNNFISNVVRTSGSTPDMDSAVAAQQSLYSDYCNKNWPKTEQVLIKTDLLFTHCATRTQTYQLRLKLGKLEICGMCEHFGIPLVFKKNWEHMLVFFICSVWSIRVLIQAMISTSSAGYWAVKRSLALLWENDPLTQRHRAWDAVCTLLLSVKQIK